MTALVLAALLLSAPESAHLPGPRAHLPGPRVHLSDPEAPGVGPYSLPVPDSTVTLRDLRAPHHDYPASDLMVPVGTPVFAVHQGRVATFEGRRCGLGVALLAGDRHRYVSCHLSVVSVADGAPVAAGDVLGLSGDTGNAQGVPHLHFQMAAPGGGLVCPQALLVDWYAGRWRAPRPGEPRTGCFFARD